MLTATLPAPVAPPFRTAAPATLYGRRWCAYSRLARRRLDRLEIPYDYVDLDRHPEDERRLAETLGGRVYSPVVQIADELLRQPDPSELDLALWRAGWGAANPPRAARRACSRPARARRRARVPGRGSAARGSGSRAGPSATRSRAATGAGGRGHGNP